jgi:hypothetical protein
MRNPIRPQDGEPVVTDGPLAEAKEHFGGYLIVDCDTPERATEIASRWPNARFAAMEVRPIMNVGPRSSANTSRDHRHVDLEPRRA